MNCLQIQTPPFPAQWSNAHPSFFFFHSLPLEHLIRVSLSSHGVGPLLGVRAQVPLDLLRPILDARIFANLWSPEDILCPSVTKTCCKTFAWVLSRHLFRRILFFWLRSKARLVKKFSRTLSFKCDASLIVSSFLSGISILAKTTNTLCHLWQPLKWDSKPYTSYFKCLLYSLFIVH